MSSDEDGLVRALLADPWDELARSAYADWLDDHGEALHAEVLRARGTPRRVEATNRIRERMRETFAQFSLDVIRPSGLLFVTMPTVTYLSPQFQGIGADWLRRNHVAVLSLGGRSGDWAGVVESPVTPRLKGLILSGDCQSAAAALERDGSPASGLCSLGLRNGQMTLAEFRSLLTSRTMPALVGLTVAQAELGLGLLQSLEDGPLAGQLEHLDLRDSHLGNVGVEQLAGSSRLMGGLTALRLGGAVLANRGVEALAASPFLGKLRCLDIGGGAISDGGLATLAASGLLARLRWLSLLENQSGTPVGYRTLARVVAGVPGLRLELGGHLDEALRDELREMLGPRLVG
jgi:uncharacterized protein (TIGR02996 family)